MRQSLNSLLQKLRELIHVAELDSESTPNGENPNAVKHFGSRVDRLFVKKMIRRVGFVKQTRGLGTLQSLASGDRKLPEHGFICV
jgi:hypothetical protein